VIADPQVRLNQLDAALRHDTSVGIKPVCFVVFCAVFFAAADTQRE
jgi:hypothetical protein